MMKNKIESIQILRGLAALSVVMFHYRFYLVPEDGDLTIPDQLFGWGAIGVDLFFVISGFIMIYVTRETQSGFSSSLKFLGSRLTRILPTYYIILLFAFLTGGAMSTFHYPEKVSNLISALTFQPYQLDPAPLYTPGKGMYNVRWTLNYEIYFYIAFGMCLLFKNRVILLATWFLLPIVISYLLTSNVTFSTSGYKFNSVIARFVTNPIILEFGIGALAGYAYFILRNKFKFNSCYLSLAIFLVVVAGIFYNFFNGYNLTSAFVFFFLVLIFALQNKYILKFTPKPLITLGNISFSLYLIHNPLAIFISGKVENVYPNAMHTTAGFIILLAASIPAAMLCHKYLEIMLTNKIRSLIKKIQEEVSSKNKAAIKRFR
ncbi:MAG: acyltransferase [Hafnia sp.]